MGTGTYGPLEEHGARLAPEQKGAQGDSIPLGSRPLAPRRHPVPKHGSGVLIKIPSSILIGWGLLILLRTMRTGSAQAYGSGPTANQIARIS